MDMVCTRDADAGEYDPSLGKSRVFRAKEQGNDVVEAPNGDWLKAFRTTLGADDGVGVAAMLAVVADAGFSHGPLDLLFTVQEEAGLVGATNLDPTIIEGKILLNLDSEEEGIFTIGSAGGRDTQLGWVRSPLLGTGTAVARMVSITGLLGGHSGVDINRGRLNAIHGLVRLLQAAASCVPLQVASLDGGDRSNAIPREARAVVVLPQEDEALFRQAIDSATKELVAQYGTIEASIKVSVEVARPGPAAALSAGSSVYLLSFLRTIPSGVIAMSVDLAGLVETSTSFGVVKTTAGSVDITCSSRSSVSAALDDVTATLTSTATVAGASAVPGPAYPGWKPDPNSPTLKVLRSTYKKLFSKDAEVAAVHAGLECGVINGKIPNLDTVSFGPTVVGAHSTRERVHIESVVKFYKLLTAALTNLSGGAVDQVGDLRLSADSRKGFPVGAK
jgi:dipeptidase D